MNGSDSSAPYRSALLAWYRSHARDLPWRRSRDPYGVWVSEIMLQQTQVATVLPYYERWMRRFPTAQSLAEAEEADVLALWQGLGYYRRCKHLLAGARWVQGNELPKTAKDWLKVPGVGPYTAAAIASIAYGEPVPLVDGNVERVFARLTGHSESGAQLHRAAWVWAEEVLDRRAPGDWNQALMELGATVCKPKAPDCHCCPAKGCCFAEMKGVQESLPVAAPKAATVREAHWCWIPICGDKFGLRQIPEGQWWAGMWEFPRAVGTEPAPPLAELSTAWGEALPTLSHSVTHHRIRLHPFLVRLDVEIPGLTWLGLQQLSTLPMPAPQRKALRFALEALGLGKG